MVLVTPQGEVQQIASVRVEALPKALFPVVQAALAQPVGTRDTV
jgi:hypothetical protein